MIKRMAWQVLLDGYMVAFDLFETPCYIVPAALNRFGVAFSLVSRAIRRVDDARTLKEVSIL